MEALMIRTSDCRVKPTLEDLEDPIQPSFLLGAGLDTGNVAALAAPLGSAVMDMQNAQTKLTTDINAIKSASSTASAEAAYASSVSDYQRIWNDFATVNVIVPVDMNFMNAVATSVFLETGNVDDLAILRIPFLTNIFNPFGPLNNDLNQATSMWNNGNLTGSLTAEIMASSASLSFFLSTAQSIQASASAPIL
jgi:hypothetical protein